MGGGPERDKEHLLVILPQREPTSILERLKRRFPYVDVTFKSSLPDHDDRKVEIPAGLYLGLLIRTSF